MDDLSRRERQVMDALYRIGSGTPEQILDELPDPPTNSAIRSTLRILREKGFLRYTTSGRSYVYRPVRSRKKAGKKAMHRMIETFFDGSAIRAAASLIEEGSDLTKEEVVLLEKLIAQARREGR